jgi:multicomponent Na+:H+ antiporter subunit A
MASGITFDHLVWWDRPIQAALGVAVIASAVAGAFVGSRLGAALTLGAVGIGVTGLFIVHGAPDLALTQLLVETVIVVGFVLGLGHLAQRFPPVEDTWKTVRIVVSVAGGLAVTMALAAAGANPAGRAPIEALTTGAVDEGGGKNVVNVILTDLRALDTFGEVVVLATVAIGILALAKGRSAEVAS